MIKGLFLMLVMVFLGATLLVGQSLYLSDIESGEVRDIYNLTNSLTPQKNICYQLHNQSTILSIPEIKINRLENIACSLSEFMVTVAMETAKFGVEFGYENPQYDYDFFIGLFKFYVYIILFCAIIPVIIPLIALVYLLSVGVKKIISFVKFKIKKKNGTR